MHVDICTLLVFGKCFRKGSDWKEKTKMMMMMMMMKNNGHPKRAIAGSNYCKRNPIKCGSAITLKLQSGHLH